MTWLKDGSPLPASNRFSTHYDIHTGVARLKINDSVLNDAGIYTVVAENKAGSDRTNGRLEIIKEAPIDNKPIVNPNAFANLNRPDQRIPSDSGEQLQPPRIVIPLSNIHIIEQQPCRLACRVEGYPKPSVVWFKNGTVLPASNRYTPSYDLKTGVASLKINETQPNDSGFYEVVAENKVGSDRTNANLVVDHSPSIDKTSIVDPRAFRYLDAPVPSQRPSDSGEQVAPPRVIIPLKDIRVNEGQPATLLTKIVGHPLPKVLFLL